MAGLVNTQDQASSARRSSSQCYGGSQLRIRRPFVLASATQSCIRHFWAENRLTMLPPQSPRIPNNTHHSRIMGMESQLCHICLGIFTGQQILREPRPHHQSKADFLAAAADGCPICRLISRSPGFVHLDSDTDDDDGASLGTEWHLGPWRDLRGNSNDGWLRLTIDMLPDHPGRIEADFDLEHRDVGCQDVDVHGNVVVPESSAGVEIESYEDQMAPAWAMAVIPVSGECLLPRLFLFISFRASDSSPT